MATCCTHSQCGFTLRVHQAEPRHKHMTVHSRDESTNSHFTSWPVFNWSALICCSLLCLPDTLTRCPFINPYSFPLIIPQHLTPCQFAMSVLQPECPTLGSSVSNLVFIQFVLALAFAFTVPTWNFEEQPILMLHISFYFFYWPLSVSSLQRKSQQQLL